MILEKKLLFRKQSFHSRYRGIETSNLSVNDNLEAKLRFWKRNVDPGNEASNLSYNKKLSYPKENFDLRNEALILKTKLQIWVAITSCKQSFEFELQQQNRNEALIRERNFDSGNKTSIFQTKLWICVPKKIILETKFPVRVLMAGWRQSFGSANEASIDETRPRCWIRSSLFDL